MLLRLDINGVIKTMLYPVLNGIAQDVVLESTGGGICK